MSNIKRVHILDRKAHIYQCHEYSLRVMEVLNTPIRYR